MFYQRFLCKEQEKRTVALFRGVAERRGGEKRMKKTRVLSAILVSVIAALLLATSVQLAFAKEFVSVSFTIKNGAFIGQPTVRVAGESENQFVTYLRACKASGDIASSGGTLEVKLNRHEVGTPDAWSIEHNVFTLTDAAFQGKNGDLTLLLEGSTPGGNRPDQVPGYTWRILSGTEGLESLHGQGTIVITMTPPFMTWVGEVHFSP
jgi:hypothetical protein